MSGSETRSIAARPHPVNSNLRYMYRFHKMLSSFEEIFSVDVSLNKPKPAKLGVWALGVWRPHSRPYCSTQKPNVGLLLFPDPTVVLLLLFNNNTTAEAPQRYQSTIH